MTRTPNYPISDIQNTLDRVRSAAPLVHCITNAVVTNFTANVVLALGASPAMADVPGEAGPFARIASALLINLGSPHEEQRRAMIEAAEAATEAGTPWVLDPVAVGVLPVRTPLAYRLRDLRPTVIRGNASEILALAEAGAGGRGVDSTDSPEAALEAGLGLARDTGAVVAISGPVDILTDGSRVLRLANGTETLTRVTGGGCALGAVLAAFAAVSASPLDGAVAAVTSYCVAAELAEERSGGPGTFAPEFLDALASVGAADLAARAAVTEGDAA